jgi:hypothetical protein
MIKIISGYQFPAGSIVALVNLCNQLNSKGHASEFYGLGHWHRDKCRSGDLQDFYPEEGDVIVLHEIAISSFDDLYSLKAVVSQARKSGWRKTLQIILAEMLGARAQRNGIKIFLTCQGQISLGKMAMRYSLFDKVHFVSEGQSKYCRIKRPKFICPNFIADLKHSSSKPVKVAGIIGSINKKYDVALLIEMALREGMNTVILYGDLADPIYFYKAVVPLMKKHPGRIKFAGFVGNQQRMYDTISDAYVAIERPWSNVRRECAMTGTNYHGASKSEVRDLTNDEILEIWEKELEL